MEEYLGIIKRSPSPPQETCRNPPIPDWWVQQPNPSKYLVALGVFTGTQLFVQGGDCSEGWCRLPRGSTCFMNVFLKHAGSANWEHCHGTQQCSIPCMVLSSVFSESFLACWERKARGWQIRVWERMELGTSLTSLVSLPTALPLMNGYTGYEQHHSGEAAPIPLCVSGLWASRSSLGLGLAHVCVCHGRRLVW